MADGHYNSFVWFFGVELEDNAVLPSEFRDGGDRSVAPTSKVAGDEIPRPLVKGSFQIQTADILSFTKMRPRASYASENMPTEAVRKEQPTKAHNAGAEPLAALHREGRESNW